MKFPWLTEGEIEVRAAQLLARTFGRELDRSHPVDVEAIVLHLSETDDLVFDDDADLRGDDGEIVLGKTQPLKRRILLSRELKLDADSGRARFTLAHELGHWELHRPLFLAHALALDLFAESKDEFEFVGLQRAIFPAAGIAGRVPAEEWQANRFAVALLVDGDVLRAEFHRRFEAPFVARSAPGAVPRSSTLRDHSRRLASFDGTGHRPLRAIFGISVEAMGIALESRGYSLEAPPLL